MVLYIIRSRTCFYSSRCLFFGYISFQKRDWNKIFLVSADLVKEKDEIIAELQQKIEELRHNQSSDVEVEGHGKFTEKDSTDETSRYEINRKLE